MGDDDGREGIRKMMSLIKMIFDEALIVGFSQDEAMRMASLTLQGILGQALEQNGGSKKG